MRNFIRKIFRSHLIRSTWRRLIHLWKPMAAWTILIWILIAVILAPISSVILGLQLFRSGELVIGNEELLSWLFSYSGIGYVLIGASLALTGWILRFAGIFQIAKNDIYGKAVDIRNTVRRIISRIHILFRLCLFIVAAGLVLLLPLAAGLGLIYELFLEYYDINYYLYTTPLEWHLALITSITWLFLWLAGVLYVTARCLFALPAYLHTQKSIIESIVYAWDIGYKNSKDNLKYIISVTGFWIFVRFIADLLLLAIATWSINWISNQVGSLRIIALSTGLYLMISLLIDAIISFLGFSYVSTLITKLYFRDFPQLTEAPAPPARQKFKKIASILQDKFQLKWLSTGMVFIVIISFVVSGYVLERIPEPNPEKKVAIAAHRAGPPPAPENTLEALNNTIQIGAEFAEIDVQLSQDSIVVVAHDFDLMRTANHPAQISKTDFDSLQAIVKRQYLKDTLRQSKLYTLEEFLETSRDKVNLMIELKKPSAALTRSVITTIRQKSMVDEVVIISMSLGDIRRINKIAPEISVGYVSAIALGNISQLPVDVIAINHRSANNRLIAEAHKQNLEVFAWTVNRANIMTSMIERNIDGIITDNPELGIQIRKEMNQLTRAERLLLQFYQLAR